MTEPDPDVIRQIEQGRRYQNPDIPAPDVPYAAESYQPSATDPLPPTDLGITGARGADLDADEPAAIRETWTSPVYHLLTRTLP